jgi:PmbA protein
MPENMLDVARGATAMARRAGAKDAAAVAYRSRSVSVDWRDGKLEKISEATTRGVALELFVEGRYAAVSTSDLRAEALERFIGDAVAMTRKLEKDPFRALPDPDLYEGQAKVDLDLEDKGIAGMTAARRRELAEAAETAARQVKGKESILSVTTGFGDELTEGWRVHTNGFEGTRRATSFSVSAQVSAKDPDGRRPEDWDAASGRHVAMLPAAEAVGQSAAERTLARIGARKGESRALTMVVDARAAGRLVGFLFAPLSGAALQQKQSCLEGKIGEAVGSPLLHLSDDPLVPRGLGSRLFDQEGIAARRFPIFEKGVLRNYFVDTYYGRKLKMPPTTRGLSNLAWGLGTQGRAGLLADAREGILVTSFLGGNSNPTTGDFSLGVQGFRIRSGEVAEPVGEMNVSGNHLQHWKQLVALGNDPYRWSPMRTPTLVFEGVQFAGT